MSLMESLVDWTQFEDLSIETSKIEKPRKKWNVTCKNQGTTIKTIIYVQWKYQQEKRGEEVFETVMIENFPQVNVRHQNTDPGSSNNIKRITAKTK